MTAPLLTPLSNFWSLQMTPRSSVSSRTVTSLLTDRRLRSWLSGAVTTTWSWTRSKQWRWSWTSGETPPHSPTHYHEQHCNCSVVIQIPGNHHLLGPEVGQSHWLHQEKSSAEVVLPSSTEKVQPATGGYDTVLLCCYGVGSVLLYNCLVWVS